MPRRLQSGPKKKRDDMLSRGSPAGVTRRRLFSLSCQATQGTEFRAAAHGRAGHWCSRIATSWAPQRSRALGAAAHHGDSPFVAGAVSCPQASSARGAGLVVTTAIIADLVSEWRPACDNSPASTGGRTRTLGHRHSTRAGGRPSFAGVHHEARSVAPARPSSSAVRPLAFDAVGGGESRQPAIATSAVAADLVASRRRRRWRPRLGPPPLTGSAATLAQPASHALSTLSSVSRLPTAPVVPAGHRARVEAGPPASPSGARARIATPPLARSVPPRHPGLESGREANGASPSRATFCQHATLCLLPAKHPARGTCLRRALEDLSAARTRRADESEGRPKAEYPVCFVVRGPRPSRGSRCALAAG